MISRTLRSIALYTCCSMLLIQASLPPQQPTYPYPSFQPNIYVIPQNSASANPIMSSTQATTTSVHHCVEHTVSVKCPDIHLPTMSSMFENMASTGSTLQSWLWSYKWNIAAVVAVYAYCATYYQLRQTNNMLQKSDSWCIWKEITPLGHLVITIPHDLRQQLQFDIHKKYYRALDAQNNQTAHTLFLQDTSLEMELLDSYLALHDFYHAMHMNKFLPFKYTPEVIHERKARLQFVIDLFIKWHLQQ